MDDQGIYAKNCATWQRVPVDYGHLWREKTLEYEASVRVNAQRFVNDGIASISG